MFMLVKEESLFFSGNPLPAGIPLDPGDLLIPVR
jgi:hypothetical protein